MANGEATHEWRLGQLEERMDKVEAAIQRATYLLIGNLVSVVILLGIRVLGGK